MTVESLENFKKEKIHQIAEKFREFVKKEYISDELKDWPRLAYVNQGKSGYHDHMQSYITARAFPIHYGGKIFLSVDSLDFLEWSYVDGPSNGKLKVARDETVADLDPNSLDFHDSIKELWKSYRKEKHRAGIVLPDRWFKEAILIGLDLSYEDLKSHYRGIEHEMIYEKGKVGDKEVPINLSGIALPNLNEKKFLEIKKSFTSIMAKKMLKRNKEKKRFQIWDDDNEDLLEDDTEKNSRWH
jgi:hypothetical protein